MVKLIRTGKAAWRRWGKNTDGVSALEFALILPLMLTLYLGSIEMGDAFAIKRKVTRVTSALNDLVTQSRTITDNDMDNILDAAQSIVVPYPASELRIKITGVEIDNRAVARVVWSDARNDTPYSAGAKIAIPSALALKNSFLVTAEVSYTYKPKIGYLLTGTFDLKDQFYLRPRLSADIKRPVR